VLAPGEDVSPILEPFNEHLEASTQNLDPDMQDRLQKAFGSQIEISNGTAKWQSSPSAIPATSTPAPTLIPNPPSAPAPAPAAAPAAANPATTPVGSKLDTTKTRASFRPVAH